MVAKKIGFVSHRLFHQSTSLFLARDGLHLNKFGARALASNFRNVFRHQLGVDVAPTASKLDAPYHAERDLAIVPVVMPILPNHSTVLPITGKTSLNGRPTRTSQKNKKKATAPSPPHLAQKVVASDKVAAKCNSQAPRTSSSPVPSGSHNPADSSRPLPAVTTEAAEEPPQPAGPLLTDVPLSQRTPGRARRMTRSRALLPAD